MRPWSLLPFAGWLIAGGPVSTAAFAQEDPRGIAGSYYCTEMYAGGLSADENGNWRSATFTPSDRYVVSLSFSGTITEPLTNSDGRANVLLYEVYTTLAGTEDRLRCSAKIVASGSTREYVPIYEMLPTNAVSCFNFLGDWLFNFDNLRFVHSSVGGYAFGRLQTPYIAGGECTKFD